MNRHDQEVHQKLNALAKHLGVKFKYGHVKDDPQPIAIQGSRYVSYTDMWTVEDK